MKDFKIDNKGSARLFSNKILEGLTRTHFLIPVLLYYVISLILIAWTWWNNIVPLIHIVWLFPVGVICFTLVEYMIHRFIFHFDAKTEKELDLQYNMHGVHHEFPRDKDGLVMPPVISILIAGIFFIFFNLLFAHTGLILFAGFSAGYSTYLMIHYFIHARKPPRNFLIFIGHITVCIIIIQSTLHLVSVSLCGTMFLVQCRIRKFIKQRNHQSDLT